MSVSAASLDLEALLGLEARRSPTMEAVWDWLVEQDSHVPDWTTLDPQAARALQDGLTRRWNAELPAMESTEPLLLEGAPPIATELSVPRGARPGCIVYFHGGGWAFGNIATHARLARLLAEDTGLRVVSVDYRLAPEHPAPAAFEDAVAAWRAVAALSRTEAFDGPLIVAGDSAGANLALAVILAEIHEERRKPDLGLLFYGVYGADLDTPSYARFAEGFGLTRAGMRRFWDWYAPPGGALSRDDFRLCPLAAAEADLARLPPLFLNAAGLDPLLCDTIAMARRIEAANVPHRLVLHQGVHHGFMQMSLRLPEARTAIREAAAFVAEHTGG